MSNANLHFPQIFIHVSHPLYICMHNIQAAMDKENCGLTADIGNGSLAISWWGCRLCNNPNCQLSGSHRIEGV